MSTTIFKTLAAALFGLMLAAASAAQADPMKCSGEEKVCLTNCKKAARVAYSVCATGCGARLSTCMKTGCWDNGTQRYCGLAKL
jgi:hypothetical protein